MNKIFTNVFAVAITCCSLSGYGQLLAASSQRAPAQFQDKPVPVAENTLKDAFDKLQTEYHVSFIYKSEILSRPLKGVLNSSGSLTDELKALTSSNGLEYKKVRDDFYVIFLKGEAAENGGLENASRSVVIKGKITDEKGLPVPGVVVSLKGSTLGTSTDINGNYALNTPDGSGTLVFSFIGYVKQEVVIGSRTQIDISLKPDVQSLSEVVVVAYGTQKKVDVTGAVATVSGKDLSWKPVGQVSESLQGVISGVTVTQGTGQPGLDQGAIRIRGVGTLNNNNALVLVDGLQTDIDNIDPNDIESTTVLKDAAASSIYGVRAANGVILITTKRGASGKVVVNYSDYFGKQDATRISQFVGAQEFMNLSNLMYTNSGAGAVYSAGQIAQYNNPNRDLNLYPDNYWLKKILTGGGFQQQHSVSLAGGTDKNSYRFSANYFDQDGIVKNMDYDRLTIRLNTDSKITDKIDFSADISANISNRSEPQGVAGSAWYQFSQATIANPLTVSQYTDGTWATVRGGQNPLLLQQQGGTYNYKTDLFTGNFKLNYNIVKGLTITGLASDSYQTNFNSINDKSFDYTDYTTKAVTTIGQNDISNEYIGTWLQNYQALLNYKTTFGKHSFSFLGGASRLSQTYNDLSAFRNDIPDGSLSQINAGSASTATNTGTASDYLLISYFGRMNYSYDDKYLFEANIRRDGSSRFPTGSNWGWFPSFSAGWNIAKESFMQNVSAVQTLKLRGSWGELGNDNPLGGVGAIPNNYPYQSPFSYNYSYPFGGVLNTAASQSIYTNNGLTWETTKMADIGLDLGVLQNKLTFTFDYFKKNTDNILYALPIPSYVGFSPAYQNAGSVQNTGFEFAINYKGSIGSDFKYNVGGNVSLLKNKITDLKGADFLSTDNNNVVTGYQTGSPIGSYYGYQAQGIFQSAAQVAAHANQGAGTAAGDLIYKDVNGDGVIDSKDRVYLGSNIPRFTYGFNLNASYQGFDFSALLQGVAKVEVSTLVADKAPTSTDGNFKTIEENSWTPTNTSATYPRLVTTTQNYQSSSYWIRSGAYLRVKSMQLGYSIKPSVMTKIGLSKLRIYVAGQNLFTFSSLPSDIDPEAQGDNRYYPQVKTYTVGLNATF